MSAPEFIKTEQYQHHTPHKTATGLWLVRTKAGQHIFTTGSEDRARQMLARLERQAGNTEETK